MIPSDRDVKLYIGSWGEWMESVGVSWEEAEEWEPYDEEEQSNDAEG